MSVFDEYEAELLAKGREETAQIIASYASMTEEEKRLYQLNKDKQEAEHDAFWAERTVDSETSDEDADGEE